jgi:hypothetical protein
MFEYFDNLLSRIKDYYSPEKKEERQVKRYLREEERMNSSCPRGPFPAQTGAIRFFADEYLKKVSHRYRIVEKKYYPVTSLTSGPFPLMSDELRFIKEKLDHIKSEGKRASDSKNSKDITGRF